MSAFLYAKYFKKEYFPLFFFTISLLFINSCTPHSIGYGVVLWAEKESTINTGELIEISKKTDTHQIYHVLTEEESVTVQIPIWRVEFFDELPDAEEFSEAYKPYIDMFGYTDRENGLPVRKEANKDSEMIYKLQPGQIVKVISRSEQKVKIARYKAYWYCILTHDGYLGYSYGKFFNTISDIKDPLGESN